MSSVATAQAKTLSEILPEWKGSPFFLSGKKYATDEIYTTIYQRIFGSLREFVRDQDPNGLQLISFSDDHKGKYVKPKDLNLASCERGVFPEIIIPMVLYFPQERDRNTQIRFREFGTNTFNLPYPHRYFTLCLYTSFNHNCVNLYYTIEQIHYALRPAHIAFKDTPKGREHFINSFIGTWLPNHDYGYYCGNKEFRFDIKSFDGIVNLDIKNHLDEIFTHYMNSVYNQDLLHGGIESPASAYLCKKLPIMEELKRRLALLPELTQIEMKYNVNNLRDNTALVRQGKYSEVRKGWYNDAHFSKLFVLSVATVLQEHQDFWERTRVSGDIRLGDWMASAHASYKQLKTRANIYSILSKILSLPVKDKK